MKRRQFITSVPVTVGGMTVTAYGASPMLSALTASLIETDRVLVIVQLSGGNDGLNTVIPLDQYSVLSTKRANVLIPEDKVLKLSGTNNKTGLHPAMSRFQQLWDLGQLSIIQGVGYPNFNFSHFRATDIWMSGSDSNVVLESGWAGRYLNYEYPNFPVGFPNTTMPDPLAIRIGGNVGLGLQNLGVNMGISINNTKDPLNLTGSIYKDPASSDYKGKELLYIREVQRQTDKYGDAVAAAAAKGMNKSTLYPGAQQPGEALGNALKIISLLVSGGLKTRIYWVSTGGFDTHANQVVASDTSTGNHANLLKGVSDAVYAFMDDCKLLNIQDRVTGFTFSEFGRRIVSNQSGGTDHGSALPMFVFGSKVIGGMIGQNPIIDPAAGTNSNIPMQYDFRSVYSSLLKDWFCVPESDLEDILLKNFQNLPLVDPAGCIPTNVHDTNNEAGENLVYAYPNPFTESTNIKFETLGGHTLLHIFNNAGVQIKVLVDRDMEAGKYDIPCDLGDAPAGLYYIRMQNGPNQQVKPLMKIRG